LLLGRAPVPLLTVTLVLLVRFGAFFVLPVLVDLAAFLGVAVGAAGTSGVVGRSLVEGGARLS
jgi:hypothetical protein